MTDPIRFGRYTVTRVLGRGAMGVVYHAEDPVISREVAIKVIKAFPGSTDEDLADLQRRFEREFRANGTLSHPGIVTVYDVGHEGENAFIAMEYLAGESLDDQMKSAAGLSLERVVDVIDEVGAALDYAHSQGVVHRDVKPANIMSASDGRFKLADFGIATLNEDTLTVENTQIGTPSFMSPEQVLGKRVAGASDQFSLGLIAYRLLTGQRAFDGESMSSIMYQISEIEPPKPSELNPMLSAELSDVVMRSLAKNPQDRFPNCRDFARALKTVVTEGSPYQATVPVARTSSSSDDAWADEALNKPATGHNPLPEATTGWPPRATSWAAVAGFIVVLGAAGLVWTSGVMGPVIVETTVAVDSNPPGQGLAIWVDDAPLGLLTPAVIPLQGPEGQVVRVQLFRDNEVVVSTAMTLGEELSSEWVPEVEVPILATRFDVTTDPAGARVSIDGRDIARPTPVEVDLFPGQSYEIGVALEGYESATATIDPATVEPGETPLDFSLRRLIRPARVRGSFASSVTLVFQPAGGGRARRAQGRNPRLDLSPGRYTITVTAPDIFWGYTTDATLREGEAVPLREMPRTVTIPVYDVGGAAIVRIDDFPPFQVAGPKTIAVGTHRFVFEWPSGQSTTQTVRVDGNTRQVTSRHP